MEPLRGESRESSVPLLGRREELSRLGKILHRVAGGESLITLIEGEGGIGKTRLLGEILEQATKLGYIVLRGNSNEAEQARPFGVVARALAPGGTGFDRRSDVSMARDETQPATFGDRPAELFLVLESVLAVVERLGAEGPTVIALEDLHWADPSSLLVVQALGMRSLGLPVLVVATFRPPSRGTGLNKVVAGLLEHGAEHIKLGGLSPSEVDELAEGSLESEIGPRLRSQLKRAGGNALFVLELVRTARSEGLIEVIAGRADTVDDALPVNLRHALLRRLSALSHETVEILRVAAVLGSSFDIESLCLVLGKPVVEVWSSIDDAMRAGLLTESDDRSLSFRHDLIREAIYLDVPRPIRSALHREAGNALMKAEAPAIQVAHHLSLGARPGDRSAVAALRAAAAETVGRSPAAAVGLLRRALELSGPGDASYDEILAELVVSLSWAGQLSEAIKFGRQGLATPQDASAETNLRLGLVEALVSLGRMDEAERESAVAVATSQLAGSARARLSALLAFVPLFVGDAEPAVTRGEQALLEGESTGDDLAVCSALCALAQAAVFEGDPQKAVELASRAVQRAQASGSPTAHKRQSYMFLANALTDLDRLGEAKQAHHRGRAVAEDLGIAFQLPFYQWALTRLHFLAGDWDDARAEAESGELLAEEFNSRHGVATAYAVLAMIDVHQNDLPAARNLVPLAEAEVGTSGRQLRQHWVPWARALVEEAEGDQSRSLEAAIRAWDLITAAGHRSEYPLIGLDIVRLMHHHGRDDDAAAVVEEVAGAASQMHTPSAQATALMCRAIAGQDKKLSEMAVQAASPRPLLHAQLLEHAALLGGAGPLRIDRLQRALSKYEALGAARDVLRVKSLLREAGVVQGHRGNRGRDSTGWGALTPTELKVVELIAQGLTYKEAGAQLFISPRTVETHVTHAFTKLGCSSRGQLRSEVARHFGSGSPN